jgi:hypothetical protein
MLKTLIIATVLLPRLAIAQQPQQLPQPGCWMASGSYCVSGSDKAPSGSLKSCGDLRPGETPIYGPDGKYQGSVHHLVVRRKTLEREDAQA